MRNKRRASWQSVLLWIITMSVLVFAIGVLGGLVFAAVAGEETNQCTVHFDASTSGVGVLNRTFNGMVYCEYLGIRYVEPPIGSLRFKNPVLRSPKGLEDYQKLGSICAQLDTLGQASKVFGDEDCLFMNVYSPLVPGGNRLDRKYPVLAYIHGGSYAMWSPQTDMFGVDLLIESGVLIVSFNYRLFVLGFLHYPEYNITGNFGLKDQLAALQWIQRYIEPFGGDPNNVTLMGQSVGSHSVTYHLYLEPAQGLFHQAIAMSGSLLAPSAMIYMPQDYTSKYLKSLNISSYDELMSASFQDLYQFHPDKRRFCFASINLPIFLPTVELNNAEALLTEPAHELILREPVNKIPLMIGMTDLEFSSYFTGMASYFSDENFPNRDNTTVLNQVRALLQKAAVVAKRKQPEGAGRHFYGKLGDLANMYFPVKRLLRQLSELESYQAPIYYYRFAYDGKFGKYKNDYYKGEMDLSYGGAMHGDDLGYLFSPYNVREALDNRTAFKTEWKVAERHVKRFSNFVKYGNPTPNMNEHDEIIWPPFNVINSTRQFLHINSDDEIRRDDDRTNFIFQVWNRVHDCYFYYECAPVESLLDTINRVLGNGASNVDLEGLFDKENLT